MSDLSYHILYLGVYDEILSMSCPSSLETVFPMQSTIVSTSLLCDLLRDEKL